MTHEHVNLNSSSLEGINLETAYRILCDGETVQRPLSRSFKKGRFKTYILIIVLMGRFGDV